jgi:hypothetical protein
MAKHKKECKSKKKKQKKEGFVVTGLPHIAHPAEGESHYFPGRKGAKRLQQLYRAILVGADATLEIGTRRGCLSKQGKVKKHARLPELGVMQPAFCASL